MGCALSSPEVTSDPAVAEGRPRSAPEDGLGSSKEVQCPGNGGALEPLQLSEAQKTLVRESWEALHKDIVRVGIIVFIRLFETHPECKDAFFLFRDIEDLQQLRTNKDLQAHGLSELPLGVVKTNEREMPERLRETCEPSSRRHRTGKTVQKTKEYISMERASISLPYFHVQTSPAPSFPDGSPLNGCRAKKNPLTASLGESLGCCRLPWEGWLPLQRFSRWHHLEH